MLNFNNLCFLRRRSYNAHIKIVFFFTIIVIVFTFFNLVNTEIIKSVPYKCNTNIVTLMMGDSQASAAFSPYIIPNSINVSKNGEPINVTYYKLKYIILNNYNIKNVLINVSGERFTKRIEDKFLKKSSCQEFVASSYPFMTLNDFGEIPINRTAYYETYIRNMLIPNFYLFRVLFNRKTYNEVQHPFIQGYNPSERGYHNQLNVVEEINHRFYKTNKSKVIFANYLPSYIDSCAKFLNDQGVRLILVNIPVTKDFDKAIPEEIKKFQKFKVNEVMKLYENVVYLNYMSMEGYDVFRDYIHLNKVGSEVISKKILYDMTSLECN